MRPIYSTAATRAKSPQVQIRNAVRQLFEQNLALQQCHCTSDSECPACRVWIAAGLPAHARPAPKEWGGGEADAHKSRE